MGVRKCLAVVLTCIHLMMSDSEHLFTGLLCTSPLGKCRFRWPIFNWAVFVVAAVKLRQFLAPVQTDPAQTCDF